MKHILSKIRISALLCSAALVAGPALAQGVGAGATVGAPGAGIGTNAGAGIGTTMPAAPGTGIGANAGAGISTTTPGALNGNAAVNPSIGAPNAANSANLGGSAGINTTTTGNLNTQTPASQLAEKSRANADAAQRDPRQLTPQAPMSGPVNSSINGQAAATANGAVPAQ